MTYEDNGLVSSASVEGLIVDNHIAGYFGVGVGCNGADTLRDNLASPAITVPYDLSGACVDAGNNH